MKTKHIHPLIIVLQCASLFASIAIARDLPPAPVPPVDPFKDGIALPFDDHFTREEFISFHSIYLPDYTIERQFGYFWLAPQSGLVSLSERGVPSATAELFLGTDFVSSFRGRKVALTKRPLRFFAFAGETYHFLIHAAATRQTSRFDPSIYLGVPPEIAGVLPISVPRTIKLTLRSKELLPDDTHSITPLFNDNFGTPLELTEKDYHAVLLTTGATFEATEQTMLDQIPGFHYDKTLSGGLWLSWTAPVTGTAKFSLRTPQRKHPLIRLGAGGDSIASIHWGISAYNAIAFRCIKGMTYRVYILNQQDDSGFLRVHAAGRR